MSDAPYPVLALATPQVGTRGRQSPAVPPSVVGPGSTQQAGRLSPQFRELSDAFEHGRATLTDDASDEVDPELVVVFDLAGSVQDFKNAIDKIDGLEFLAELIDDAVEPDDDFYMYSRSDGRTDDKIARSLYLVMSNSEAVRQLVRLFERWVADPEMVFDRGLAKFRAAFNQLRTIRRWGPEDRIRETGLIEAWREKLEVVGQSVSVTLVEVELWYRRLLEQREAAEEHLKQLATEVGGRIVSRADIAQIGYHALLIELPIQQVEAVLRDGASAIQLLTSDDVMFVTPFEPMSVGQPEVEAGPATEEAENLPRQPLPRIALLDGLPVENHALLTNRLIVDDPDDLSQDYSLSSRHHGTAMASLILHGDLSSSEQPLDRPLYVRPILQPHEFLANSERVLSHVLLTDLLHRAVRRVVEGENGRPPTAPSVRIFNLSIGAEVRAFVRRMSAVGRLLDWLSLEYNLLFVVSAGNHSHPVELSRDSLNDVDSAREDALRSAKATAKIRGILPPGDSLNALTVGATHADAGPDIDVPSTAWDLGITGLPAFYGAVGPGVGRSIKPELHHAGGRALYSRPVDTGADETQTAHTIPSLAMGPGTRVAAPGRGGSLNNSVFTFGTSNATALVTREASHMFDLLEAGEASGDPAFPDPLFHPVLAKALLVHASEWGDGKAQLRRALSMDPQKARKDLTTLLGYGALDTQRFGGGAPNRATLIAGGSIGRDQRHTYSIPLPSSLRRQSEWHRLTVTLAYFAPTSGSLTRYRGTKVFFDAPEKRYALGDRQEADHHAVRRGTCQHEILEGSRALAFTDSEGLSLHVDCMKDGSTLRKGKTVRYGLVISIETRVGSGVSVHDEVRSRLRANVTTSVRDRVAT
jgi:hypothetical protein